MRAQESLLLVVTFKTCSAGLLLGHLTKRAKIDAQKIAKVNCKCRYLQLEAIQSSFFFSKEKKALTKILASIRSNHCNS